MIWNIAQIEQVNDIAQNSYAQLGFLGLLIFFVVAAFVVMGLVIRYLVKKNDGLIQDLKASHEARLKDAQDFSKLEQIPKDEIINFIKTWRDLASSNNNRTGV